MEEGFSINELPFEILMDIFEYFTIPQIARFPMTCTHWRDLMQQDHFWASLARKTYGQYVGETPTKKQLLELSERCGQELTFMHWLQYRSLFGLTMNMAVHVGVSMPDDVFDYKVTLEPGLNMMKHCVSEKETYGHIHNGVSALSWNATFSMTITPEDGEPITKIIPLLHFTETTSRQIIRHRGKVFKFNLKLSKIVQYHLELAQDFYSYHNITVEQARMVRVLRYSQKPTSPLDVLIPFSFDFHGTTMKFQFAHANLKQHAFKKIFYKENPFILTPCCVYQRTPSIVVYNDFQLNQYSKILAKNFNDTIQSQMQLYLAEIVCGFEILHENGIHLKDCVPLIKNDGHLQFVCAGFPSFFSFNLYNPRDVHAYCYFGLAPEIDPKSSMSKYANSFTTDCYYLGMLILEICTGTWLQKNINSVTKVTIPNSLPVDLSLLLQSLLSKIATERPNNVTVIKKDPYFKGIDWQKMRKQQWSPKFLPNLE